MTQVNICIWNWWYQNRSTSICRFAFGFLVNPISFLHVSNLWIRITTSVAFIWKTERLRKKAKIVLFTLSIYSRNAGSSQNDSSIFPRFFFIPLELQIDLECDLKFKLYRVFDDRPLSFSLFMSIAAVGATMHMCQTWTWHWYKTNERKNHSYFSIPI